ncbi:agmatinase [Ancylobacter terrae]|uniref:agmatinase n=1 Tax=Ancylobacter sp. sgz301288 TaxID=3342077 RepID=UPI00385F2DAD
MSDHEKLEQLRAKYGNVPGGVIHDPVFKRVAELQFKDGDKRVWPFANAATFLDLPYRPDVADTDDFGGLDIAIVGVPMDLGVTNRTGARLGPRAVRAIERIGPYEHVLGMVPSADVKAADIGDLPFRSRFSLESCHEDIEAFFKRIVAAGVIPIAVGGDHSITGSILKAVGEKRPVGMLHIDAHCDTSGLYEGSKFHHGGPFRKAVLDGTIDPERTIQIGIRGGAEYLWEFSYESGMTVIHAEEVTGLGVPAIIAKAKEVLGSGPVYVTFDIDSLDPAFAPGTGTPEIGGLTSREVMEMLRGVNGIDVVGGDVVEVAPQYDATSNTAHACAQMLFEIFCLAVTAHKARQGG